MPSTCEKFENLAKTPFLAAEFTDERVNPDFVAESGELSPPLGVLLDVPLEVD
jgi:hypothetical protein